MTHSASEDNLDPRLPSGVGSSWSRPLLVDKVGIHPCCAAKRSCLSSPAPTTRCAGHLVVRGANHHAAAACGHYRWEVLNRRRTEAYGSPALSRTGVSLSDG